MKSKKIFQYDNNIIDVTGILQYKSTNPLIMGSNSYKHIDLNGLDYDLYSKIKYKNKPINILKNSIIHWFYNVVNRLYFEPNLYFIELMFGIHENKPIKWDYDEIMQKYKIINDKKIYFNENLLNEYSVIKIEIAFFNGLEFIPISNVYEFYSNKIGLNQKKRLETIKNR
jgi:hypothetical protein